ncbi:MAG: polyribonucleotide nucleotidyltransferase [Chloroflexi bacterium]|nr:polyribonucleotide nucleotidyltransferase [Chloroflexota bacterium]
MKPETKQFSAQIGGQSLTFETGKLAGQAGGAVTVRLGDAVIFAAATMGQEPKESQDFFPLTVEYEEKMYAAGKIPGSFFRREGRPSTEAILVSRLTDRPIRPLFSKDMRNEVQVIMFSLSADMVNPLDILAINGASAALMISDIPWDGPVGAARIGLIDGEFIVNPSFAQIEKSDLDLRIAGTRDAILMVECGANEVPEETMVKALDFGHQSIQPIIDAIEKMTAEVGKPKRDVPLFPTDETLVNDIHDRVVEDLGELFKTPYVKSQFYDTLEEIKVRYINEYSEGSPADHPDKADTMSLAFDEIERSVIRKRILEQSTRPDGRALDEIRPIWCEVGLVPRAHGSGLFTRGETQALTLATLGTPKEAQELDNLTATETKRYMHHYNFPPYATGETKSLRSSSRREIGHGALAERALEPVLPPVSEFPYTMRLVSEIMSSNGSSSMASVCGSTLALMDTGVPIKAPVAGIAMGLVKEGEKYAILTDIMGMEDHLGDMDFKVAGTTTGITALQMDIKIRGITTQIMAEALAQARRGRMSIMDKMLAVIPVPNPELKPHVPRITTVKVPVDKIGAIIGSGGKTIRSIQEETHTTIDIQDDGTVYIAADNATNEALARDMVLSLTETPELGRIYTGKVVRTTDFGAFVEILPNVDGMVHISQLDSMRVNKVEDVVRIGDEITVMVTGIDEGGKIRLSRQAVLEDWSLEEAVASDSRKARGGAPGSGDRRSSGDRDHNRDHDRSSGPRHDSRDRRR